MRTQYGKNIKYTVMATLLSGMIAGTAHADVVIVEMLNYDREDPTKVMVYKPEIVRAEVGDTIRFVATDPTHNAASIEGMIPEGAEPFEGPVVGDFEYVVTEEGTYGYYCVPHGAIGMGGLILVGDHTVNLEAAKSVSHSAPLLQAKFDALFAEIE